MGTPMSNENDKGAGQSNAGFPPSADLASRDAVVDALSSFVRHRSAGFDVNAARQLVAAAVERARVGIAWYDTHSNRASFASKFCRYFAVTLGVIGGLCPLVPVAAIFGFALSEGTAATSAAPVESFLKSLGFIFLGLAGGFILLDQAFGYSSSWMRHKLAQMQLERALQEFNMRSAALLAAVGEADERGSAAAELIVRLVDKFSSTVEDIVLKETETWVAEYRVGLVQLDGYLSRSRADPVPTKDAPQS
jgi:hypothetical protein